MGDEGTKEKSNCESDISRLINEFGKDETGKVMPEREAEIRRLYADEVRKLKENADKGAEQSGREPVYSYIPLLAYKYVKEHYLRMKEPNSSSMEDSKAVSAAQQTQ